MWGTADRLAAQSFGNASQTTNDVQTHRVAQGEKYALNSEVGWQWMVEGEHGRTIAGFQMAPYFACQRTSKANLSGIPRCQHCSIRSS
jgi:hypothetical protein